MAQAGTVSDKELFYGILKDLGHDEFEEFKWFLEDYRVPKSELEKANRMETVDKIIQTQGRRSMEVVKEILQKIRKHDLVEKLPNSTGGPEPTSSSQHKDDIKMPCQDTEEIQASQPSGQQLFQTAWTRGRTLEDRDEGTRVSSLKESLRTKSRRLNSDSPSVYKVPLEKEFMNIDGCQRFNFGKESLKQNRTIMLTGATGSGKSTLINGMINYIVGVNWEDDFRFKLTEEKENRSQSESQTPEVTVFKINHQEGFRVPFSLTIIDTPGFGDTRGIKRDRQITEYLRNLFSSRTGVAEIDVVCFVVQASLARLTPTQKYVFDSVLSIFGKDITENIRILVTFADGQHPPVLEAINAADVLCPRTVEGLPVYFKFNNSAIFAENKTSTAGNRSGRKAKNFDEMFWDMGTESMEMFFGALEMMKTKSLTLTQEVLREKKQLGISIEKLQELVKVGLAKLEEIKETAEKLREYEAEINRNKDFELKQKYKVAVEAKSPVEARIRKLEDEYDEVQAEVEQLMGQSTKCLNRLKEIALKPDPLSTPEYIDMLIETEKSEGKPDWKNRVQSLTDMRERDVYMDKVNRGEKLLQPGFNRKPTFAEKFWKNVTRSHLRRTLTDSDEGTRVSCLKESLRTWSRRLNSASPSVYKLPLEKEDMNIDGCQRFNFGKESLKQNRTIMLLGATGSGKSTLINAIINYIVGVNWEDDFRFRLTEEKENRSQAESQTSEVNVYKINHQEGFRVPFSLTIIDTPGFGDTRGIKRDREITEYLRNLFSSQAGVTEIDVVCFVVQASLARLTTTQKFVFDSVLSIFGKDIAENIRILVTFADGQLPPVLEAIKAADVPCSKTEDGLPVHFKFNNSAIIVGNKTSAADSKARNYDEMFWDMGTGSMEMFFDALKLMKTKSLTLTQEVLREKKQLENSIEKLQEQVKVGLAKLEEVKETVEKLREYEAEINRNKDFKIEVIVTRPFMEDISGSGIFITNCQQCHITCHDDCDYANDSDKIKCSAMGSDGYCKVCPGKCIWSVHHNMKYRWVFKDVKETKTVSELKQKYELATKPKSPVEELLRELKAEYDAVEAEVEQLMGQSIKCLNRLKEIALKPDPLSTPEYIDLLIEAEKSERKPG